MTRPRQTQMTEYSSWNCVLTNEVVQRVVKPQTLRVCVGGETEGEESTSVDRFDSCWMVGGWVTFSVHRNPSHKCELK